MAFLEKYRYYFDIDPDYFPAVNEAVITSNPEMWKKFFPHEAFVKLLKTVVNVLDRKQKLSIWVEGAYGTGKSHAVLTLKKLLDADSNDTQEYFEKYRLDTDLKNNLQRIKNSGKILTVHRYGSSNIHGDNDLVLAIQESVDRALKEAGIDNKAGDSLREGMIRYLSDTENKQSFNIYVTGSYANLFGGDDVDAIVEKLKNYQDAPLHALMDKIFKVAHERQIRAFSMTTSDLCKWLTEVIHENGLKAIVLIWDEFTEYFYNNARNLTGFQELCELSETEPFYFVLVTHVSSGLFHEGDKDFIKLNDRFVSPHCLISLPENIAFQLMGAALEKNKDETVIKDWNDIVNDLADRTEDSRKIVKTVAKINDQEMLGILPLHPYAALLLKHISTAFGSDQRSMFDFIKNDRGDEIKGFQWFIDNYGPDNDNPLLTIDMLWEFFYDNGRDLLANDVRSILDYYVKNSNQKLDSDEKRILKTVLLLQAISQRVGDAVELFIPDSKNIDLAFEGTDLEDSASHCADRLVKDKVLFPKKIGLGKSCYAAYVSDVDESILIDIRDEIDTRSTSTFINEILAVNENKTVANVISLNGALKLRYDLRYVSSSDFDQTIRLIRNKEDDLYNKIPAVVCFAKSDEEALIISKKIKEALDDGSFHIVFIDASTSPFGKDGYEQFRNELSYSIYHQKKDDDLAKQYGANAKDILSKWRNRISTGEFMVYTEEKPLGERAVNLDSLFGILQTININRYPKCLEAAYNVLPTMYTLSNLKLGVECGATRETRQTFSSGNINTKLETNLKEAWNDLEYWKTHPNLLISQIKIDVDSVITRAFKSDSGRVSIRSIYDLLEAKPYGFMPCNLTAFILGFVLKEYIDGSYSWSDGLSNDVLDLNKLKDMVSEVINLRITSNPRYKDKYIVAMTKAEKSFNETTSEAFGIPLNLCSSVEQTRERIRNKMKEFSFPIWTVKHITLPNGIKTEKAVLDKLIDYYCGIANSNNIGKSKTDIDIAADIGNLVLEYPSAKTDLKEILTKDNCTAGMREYVRNFEGGILNSLAEEIGDNGQYINILRSKFDADAANWVWNLETAQQKIREVILEYKIVAESNKVISKSTSFNGAIREWCDKCGLIRISFTAGKNYFGNVTPFLEALHSMKKAGVLLDSQKQKFLELLTAHAEEFNAFYGNQIDVFKKVCEYYLEGFTDDDVRAIYQTIPAGTFTYDKQDYISLVADKVEKYRIGSDTEKLKQLWKEKTNSETPRQWSKEHKMPILCLVPDNEVQTARSAFMAVNHSHPDASSIEKAIEYLSSAGFYSILNNPNELDRIFRESIIKSYAVMLTDVDEVKSYLSSRISSEPYDWFALPEVDKKLQQMAEDKYIREGCTKALEKIDSMGIEDVKKYLKELIKDNMVVGMEIIKES